MIRQETNAPAGPWVRRLAYGALTMTCALAVTFLVSELGCQRTPAVAVSVFSLALVLSRWPVFAMLIPLVVFYALLFGGTDLRDPPTTRLSTTSGIVIEGRLVRNDGRQFFMREATTGVNYRIPVAQVAEVRSMSNLQNPLLVFFSLLLFASTYRFAGLAAKSSSMVTSRLNYSPITARRVSATPLRLAELASLVLITLALGISAWLCSPLDRPLASGPHIGLIPEAYFAIRVVLLLALLVAVSRGVLSYLSILIDGGSRASLQLRRELWQFTGSEQRRIARHARRD